MFQATAIIGALVAAIVAIASPTVYVKDSGILFQLPDGRGYYVEVK